jgi:hypothetical protein
MNLTLRPIEAWPWKETASRGHSRFRSTWISIERLLKGEADKIFASRVILQIDVMERDIRVDGWIKGNARPFSPRVVITIERQADRETLAFHCDTFSDWQDNVYAIAKTLEALRSIDRYGVTSAGEQYTGWRAITDGTMSAADARDILAQLSGIKLVDLPSRNELAGVYRAARIRAHPDAGGSHELFVKVEEAARVLNVGVPS